MIKDVITFEIYEQWNSASWHCRCCFCCMKTCGKVTNQIWNWCWCFICSQWLHTAQTQYTFDRSIERKTNKMIKYSLSAHQIEPSTFTRMRAFALTLTLQFANDNNVCTGVRWKKVWDWFWNEDLIDQKHSRVLSGCGEGSGGRRGREREWMERIFK